ncbi:hypothetical protein EXE43_17435 [Halorubrum sp. SS5]|uniref:hypothetical protein n=1 Tax=unclassified Halorubrum TaxID=2642239 RepID=UPI0010F96DB6|nr:MULTISPECIES: hypothetical protein [unclassified Halorubrum]TKX52471.1 hypothetical protein EXE42_16200 [Halorubrum sp. SP3]TKX57244.1 hypothetical protein EXE44_10750 [Halorubrum sp. SS7]TKX64205.1 hypothetical protein EXE45_16655 [Halorubrum sp. SP9]TKX84711.1 hypothetical protein EXE43_17435 [Halorubrum sp. SS5]
MSNGQLEITSFDAIDVDPLIEEYPFDDQRILKAQFKYVKKNPFDESIERTYSGEITYRSGSQIVLVSTKSDTPSAGEIVRKLEQILPGDLEIFPGLFPSRQAIWDFIKRADDILEVEVFYKNELQPYDEIEGLDVSEVVDEYIVERADLIFRRNGQEILVTYTDESLNIQAEDTKSGDVNDVEYITQLFEREVIAK